jgi:hypothetical protein
MAVKDGSTSFGGELVELGSTVGFPAVSDDLIKAKRTLVDI